MHSDRADAIVVAWRSAQVIRRCVEALREDPAVDQIVVVNNSIEDPLEDTLAGISGVTLLNSETNLGFGSGVNLARSHITQPYVVVANADAVQSDNTASKLVEFLGEHPRAAMVGPHMVHTDGSLFLNSHHDLSLLRFVGAFWHPSLGHSRPAKDHWTIHLTDLVIAAFVTARVEALDALDWFDTSIFMFGEDQDLCRRLRRGGWEIWFAPLGRVEHISGHSWRQDPETAHEMLKQARYRELLKARGKASAFAYLALKAGADRVIRPLKRRAAP